MFSVQNKLIPPGTVSIRGMKYSYKKKNKKKKDKDVTIRADMIMIIVLNDKCVVVVVALIATC